MNVNPRASEKFMGKVVRSPYCWTWYGARTNKYPVFLLNGRYQSVVRLLCDGVPKNRKLIRLCGNPACIKPGHYTLSEKGPPPIVDKDPWL